MNSKYYKTTKHNLYSNNDYITSTKYITDKMENRFKESFDINNNIINNKNNLIVNNIYRKIKNNNSMIRKEKPFSKQLITNNNIEFFTLDNVNKKDLNKNNYKIDDLHNDNIGDPSKDLLDYQFSDLKFEGPNYPIGGNDDVMKLFDIRNKRTYGVVPENQLTHNNMVPYFRTKGNFGNSIDDEKHMSDLFNRKLELFTGSANNLDYKPKTERRPLFAPVPGLNNVYGAPVKTDFYEGRFIPSKERRNEKPFQEVRDTPGLNLGYNQVGIQGFHDPYRALPKTTNELRTADNPKLTYNNPMGGIRRKNYKKKNVYSLQPLPYSKNNIEEFEEVNNNNNNNEVMEEYETSGIGGFYAPGGGIRPVDPVVVKHRPDKFKDYHYDRHIPVSTEWHKEANYGKYDQRTLGGVNRGLEDHTHPGTTTLLTNGQVVDGEHQTTHKEQYEHDGPSNVFTKIANYVINYFNSTPEPTKRNQYNVEDKGNIKGYEQSYAYNYKDNTPDPTKRNMYNINDKGNITGYEQSYAYNYKDNTPDPTKRNQYNIDDKGNIKGYEQSYAYNYKDNTPEPTKRNQYNIDDKGNITGYDQSYVINYLNATPEATKRNQYNIDDKGNIKGYDQSYVINYLNATPGPTNRNMYNVEDKGNIKGYDKSYVINYINATPDPTKKDIHKVENYTGSINGYKQQRSRMDANNMRTNVVKDLNTIVPHGPTYSNYTKTPSMDGTIMTSNYNKLQINRELYPDIEQRVAGMDYPTVRSKVLVPNDEYHFNSFVNENLQGNPFINDTQNVYDDKINYMENTTKNNLDYIPKFKQYQ